MNARRLCAPVATLLVIGAGYAVADESMVEYYECVECHSDDPAAIGPTFQDIAARYENDGAARDALIEAIKNGGKGNWTEVTGGVPMPPYSATLSDAEIEQIVDWVLAL